MGTAPAAAKELERVHDAGVGAVCFHPGAATMETAIRGKAQWGSR